MAGSAPIPETSTGSSATSPACSSPSDPTTPPPSTSKRRGDASTSKGSSGPPIRYEDRIFICGMTSSGKSTLSRQLFLASAAPRLVIDPKGSDLTVIPGSVTFSDPGRATNPRGENWREAATARFVPADPYDLDVYSKLYDWIFAHGPRFVWVDEAGFVLPSTGGNKGGRRVLSQGRSKGIGHLACHSRPKRVDLDLIAQAAHVFIFRTPNQDDRRLLADNMGVERDVLEHAHAQLPEYGFLWWQERPRVLTICDPLPR